MRRLYQRRTPATHVRAGGANAAIRRSSRGSTRRRPARCRRPRDVRPEMAGRGVALPSSSSARHARCGSARSHSGQRGWRWQPGGGSIGLGTSPCRMVRSRRARGAAPGSPRAAPACRGGAARRRCSSVGRGLDDAAEIHHRDAVGDVLHHREIVRDEDVGEAEPLLQVRSRFRICARIDTSSADTGSSQTISFGSTASARAMAMRWRWPPENSCG